MNVGKIIVQIIIRLLFSACKMCKEVAQLVQQRDVMITGLWWRFVICICLYPLPQTPCVSAVLQLVGYLSGVQTLGFPDAVVFWGIFRVMTS